jgi:hypothetical protein
MISANAGPARERRDPAIQLCMNLGSWRRHWSIDSGIARERKLSGQMSTPILISARPMAFGSLSDMTPNAETAIDS